MPTSEIANSIITAISEDIKNGVHNDVVKAKIEKYLDINRTEITEYNHTIYLEMVKEIVHTIQVSIDEMSFGSKFKLYLKAVFRFPKFLRGTHTIAAKCLYYGLKLEQ